MAKSSRAPRNAPYDSIVLRKILTMTETKLEFWNNRAGLKTIAGTNDFPLKGLELNLILERIPERASVLDVGCGNGETLMRLAGEKKCGGVGLDFSAKMIELARVTSERDGLAEKGRFQVATLPDLPQNLGEFDYALTERCLINLDSDATQRRAVLKI